MTSYGADAALAAPDARISDVEIYRDHATYRAMQGRIQALNDKGRPLRDYHLSKSQCWLDVSFHEYTRNDRSAFPQLALEEAGKLVALLEAAPDNRPLAGPWDTPLVNGAARLRPDLWERAAALRGHSGFNACAAQRTSCAEVELVHAGNEFNQQQWRHAKPYVQIAEDQLGEAEQAAARCLPATPVAAAPVAPQAPVQAPAGVPPETTIALNANVLFNFDRHERNQIRRASLASLDAMAERIAAGEVEVQSVKLAGHADRLNSTGNNAYNKRLAERRVLTVRNYLIERGVPAHLITVGEFGDTQQVAACDKERLSQAALQECLLPNRRVEVVLTVKSTARTK
jgi:outer membrane protein OmpA-like peptidoglycan-associated protein